jgi:hypothetical protein
MQFIKSCEQQPFSSGTSAWVGASMDEDVGVVVIGACVDTMPFSPGTGAWVGVSMGEDVGMAVIGACVVDCMVLAAGVVLSVLVEGEPRMVTVRRK